MIVHGAQLIAEDGRLPAKVVTRCIAHEQGMLRRWEGKDARRLCYMPTHLHLAPNCTNVHHWERGSACTLLASRLLGALSCRFGPLAIAWTCTECIRPRNHPTVCHAVGHYRASAGAFELKAGRSLFATSCSRNVQALLCCLDHRLP